MPRPRRNARRVGPLLVASDGRTPLTPVLWRCRGCGEVKPEHAYSVTDVKRDRRRARCKDCEKVRARARQKGVSVRPLRRQRRHVALHRPSFLGAAIQQLMGGAA